MNVADRRAARREFAALSAAERRALREAARDADQALYSSRIEALARARCQARRRVTIAICGAAAATLLVTLLAPAAEGRLTSASAPAHQLGDSQ